MSENLPEWLIVCVWRALLGEIYPSIMAIAVGLSKNKNLLIRYYLDRAPMELDHESMEIVATNISASIGLGEISHIDLDCKYATESIGALDQRQFRFPSEPPRDSSASLQLDPSGAL